MLRLRFSARDLSRVSFADSDHSETLGSVQALHTVENTGLLGRWRRHTGSRITAQMQPFLDIAGHGGMIPDFLSPEHISSGTSPAVAATLPRVPAATIAADLERLDRTDTRWLRRLAAGSPDAVHELQRALIAYHRSFMEPVLPAIRAAVRLELARQAQSLLRHGVAGVLAGLAPGIRWNHPVLEVDGPFHGTVVLGGRGLRLVPSVLWPRCGFAHVGYCTPTLVYPIQPRPDRLETNVKAGALEGLVGRTRAAVLVALTVPAGTVELAERVGVSWSSASEHAAALRGAGLVSTRRQGRSVVHTLTPLGTQLVAGNTGRAG